MSILPDAHDFVISDCEFQNTQNIQNNIYQLGSTGIDILYEASTPEAAVDAEERSYAPSCYSGTRDQYIEDITKWAEAGSLDNAQPVYWMKGPAGVGKSAIAQTCAEKLKGSGQLGAAFFFSINGRRKDHTRFFPTLAHRLSTVYDDYREIVNHKISVDRSLVRKRMSFQFRSLIVEPLQELKEQGKEVQRRAIFIDGLDECESQDAQVEIIQIIASSIRAGSTPFHWAIFSREEPQIVSTFAEPNISSLCYAVFLPISRKADEEIEIYLRGGFRNILQRRNLLSLASSWPAIEDIQKLVDAAAGLFAHPATVLRFIDRHSYSGFKESLGAVLTSFTKPGTKSTILYGELDELYTVILQRVPSDILPPMLLLLSYMAQGDPTVGNFSISPACNILGISEAVFRSIYHHLQAVLIVHDPPPLNVDKAVNFKRSYLDQDSTFKISKSLLNQLWGIHGSLDFHHKSFYDFITNPTRSSTFCVTAPSVRSELFDRYVQQHLQYASSYIIQGSKLVQAPGILNSSVSLSWPQGTEFVDSFLKFSSFLNISCRLCFVDLWFIPFWQDTPLSSLRRLADLDYRKYLIADAMASGPGLQTSSSVADYEGVGDIMRTNSSLFISIRKDRHDVFVPAVFLRMVGKLERAGVIRPYNPHLGSSRAASLLNAFSRRKVSGRSYGRYKMGHGDKSVIWYWEFDTEEQYFHEFLTLKFAAAMAYYKAKKFGIWELT